MGNKLVDSVAEKLNRFNHEAEGLFQIEEARAKTSVLFSLC